MRLVARRTGLTAHVIRAWEKRYSAVTPTRTETNRRLYSEEDVQRLWLLKRATDSGHSIGQIAQLPSQRLRELTGILAAPASRTSPAPAETPEQIIAQGVGAVQAFRGEELELILGRASVALSQPALVEDVIAPLLRRLGELWQKGRLRAAHEHMASAVVRTLLGNMKESFRTDERAPRLIVTTPSAQLHELGALIATVTAAAEGWRAIYLGPNLPAAEIAAAAKDNCAKAVALSIVYPPDDPLLILELRRLRRFLGPGVQVLAGGRSSQAYAEHLEAVGAQIIDNTADLRRVLESIRGNVSSP